MEDYGPCKRAVSNLACLHSCPNLRPVGTFTAVLTVYHNSLKHSFTGSYQAAPDRQTDRQADWQTDRQTDTHTLSPVSSTGCDGSDASRATLSSLFKRYALRRGEPFVFDTPGLRIILARRSCCVLDPLSRFDSVPSTSSKPGYWIQRVLYSCNIRQWPCSQSPYTLEYEHWNREGGESLVSFLTWTVSKVERRWKLNCVQAQL